MKRYQPKIFPFVKSAAKLVRCYLEISCLFFLILATAKAGDVLDPTLTPAAGSHSTADISFDAPAVAAQAAGTGVRQDLIPPVAPPAPVPAQPAATAISPTLNQTSAVKAVVDNNANAEAAAAEAAKKAAANAKYMETLAKQTRAYEEDMRARREAQLAAAKKADADGQAAQLEYLRKLKEPIAPPEKFKEVYRLNEIYTNDDLLRLAPSYLKNLKKAAKEDDELAVKWQASATQALQAAMALQGMAATLNKTNSNLSSPTSHLLGDSKSSQNLGSDISVASTNSAQGRSDKLASAGSGEKKGTNQASESDEAKKGKSKFSISEMLKQKYGGEMKDADANSRTAKSPMGLLSDSDAKANGMNQIVEGAMDTFDKHDEGVALTLSGGGAQSSKASSSPEKSAPSETSLQGIAKDTIDFGGREVASVSGSNSFGNSETSIFARVKATLHKRQELQFAEKKVAQGNRS